MPISNEKPEKPQKDSDDIRTTCENCGADLVAEERHAGKRATCPECGSSLTIPSPQPAAPAPAPARKSASRKASRDENLRLRDEEPPPRKGGRPHRSASPTRPELLSSDAPAGHKARAKLAAWFRRVVIVIMALVVVKIFEAIYASMLVKSPGDLHGALAWLSEAIGSIPGSLHRLVEQRPVEVGYITSLERFVLGLGMLIYATRLVVRTKLLDAVYVVTERWRERSTAGLFVHFIFLLLQAGLLAWAAAAVSMPGVSDGLTSGLVALLLLTSAIWLMMLHLMARTEYPELTKWMAIDACFGLAILLVVVWPGVTQLWTRAGATSVLFLANSLTALHVGASFVFAKHKRRWWWHKPLSIVSSIIIFLLVAALMACVR